jgi:uncharacterized protein YaaQ
MTEQADSSKLCLIVVPEADGDRVLEQLVALDFGGTKVGSRGGFRKRGSSTILSAVPASEVSKVIAMLHREFPVRNESIPVQQLPFLEDAEAAGGGTIEVRVGGAVMFLLDISRLVET